MRKHLLAASLVGILGCNETVPEVEQVLTRIIDDVEQKSKEMQPKPLPPKEETRFTYNQKEGKNGELIYERHSYTVRDLPPRILEVKPNLGNLTFTILNKGLNSKKMNVAIVDSNNKVLNRTVFVPNYHNCVPASGTKIEYCLFRENLSFNQPEKDGTYKYFIEVKDDHHVVRSKPYVFKIVNK